MSERRRSDADRATIPSQALVLTAGLGTRLQPLTRVRAKPAVPVGGEALVRRIVRNLVEQSVTRLVLNLHHLPATITAVVGDGTDLGASVRYSWEGPVVLGSAGGPRQALPLFDLGRDDRLLIVNGDTLSSVDIGALAAAHASSRALVTLALTPNQEPHRYGGVQLDDGSRVAGFVARGASAEGAYHFIGVQMVQAEVFEPLPMGTPLVTIAATGGRHSDGVYNRLVAQRPGSVRGFVSNAAFWDVGTVADYMRTSQAFSKGRTFESGARVRVDPSGQISRSILWDDVQVGAGCRLDNCIVTDGVVVSEGRAYRDAVLVASPTGIEALPLTAEPRT